MTLRVGVVVTPYGEHSVDFVQQAERLGVDSVWVPEFWAGDALTPLAFLAARTSTVRLATGIVQLGARTPAMLAMSSLSMQALSGGRFVLGIGTSGPQVMEGWHGVRFDKPVQRTRETIDIVRAVTAGNASSITARSMSSRCPTAKAAVSARSCRRRTYRSTSQRSVRTIFGSPVRWPTGGSATRSSPRRPTSFSTRFVKAPPTRDARSTISTSASRLDSNLPTTSKPLAAVMPRVTHSPSARWAPRQPTSTTTHSNAKATATTCAKCNVSGSRRQEGRPERVPTEIGLGTNLIGTDDLVRDRLRLYRDAGVTTLRVGLQGDLHKTSTGPLATSPVCSNSSLTSTADAVDRLHHVFGGRAPLQLFACGTWTDATRLSDGLAPVITCHHYSRSDGQRP